MAIVCSEVAFYSATRHRCSKPATTVTDAATNLRREPPWPSLIVTHALSMAAPELGEVKFPASVPQNSALIARAHPRVHPTPHHHPPVVALLPEPPATHQVVVGAGVSRRHAKEVLAHLTCGR